MRRSLRPCASLASDGHHLLAIAQVLRLAGLAGEGRTIVEMGAGDGALSRALQHARSAGAFLLVDRSKQRMNRARAAGESAPMQQLCTDVAALRPEVLREAVPSEAVMVCNHLCGAALDAAIRCSLEAWVDAAAEGEAASEAAARGGLVGIVAVTCCHHSTQDDTFLGTDFLYGVCGLSADEVRQTRKWSVMAPQRERPAASRPRVLEAARLLGVSPVEASELGTCCRRLIDTARAKALERLGFTVALVHHVPFELTADNVMLLAMRSGRLAGVADKIL